MEIVSVRDAIETGTNVTYPCILVQVLSASRYAALAATVSPFLEERLLSSRSRRTDRLPENLSEKIRARPFLEGAAKIDRFREINGSSCVQVARRLHTFNR